MSEGKSRVAQHIRDDWCEAKRDQWNSMTREGNFRKTIGLIPWLFWWTLKRLQYPSPWLLAVSYGDECYAHMQQTQVIPEPSNLYKINLGKGDGWMENKWSAGCVSFMACQRSNESLLPSSPLICPAARWLAYILVYASCVNDSWNWVRPQTLHIETYHVAPRHRHNLQIYCPMRR